MSEAEPLPVMAGDGQAVRLSERHYAFGTIGRLGIGQFAPALPAIKGQPETRRVSFDLEAVGHVYTMPYSPVCGLYSNAAGTGGRLAHCVPADEARLDSELGS